MLPGVHEPRSTAETVLHQVVRNQGHLPELRWPADGRAGSTPWLTPLRFQGRDVWLGAISRDIGVYFTPRSWSFTTHAIDPDLDEAREALTEYLITAQAVRAVGWVRGMGEASADRPHRNLMNAPYWSDGQRAWGPSDRPGR